MGKNLAIDFMCFVDDKWVEFPFLKRNSGLLFDHQHFNIPSASLNQL